MAKGGRDGMDECMAELKINKDVILERNGGDALPQLSIESTSTNAWSSVASSADSYIRRYKIITMPYRMSLNIQYVGGRHVRRI